jgi:hypothetical protein
MSSSTPHTPRRTRARWAAGALALLLAAGAGWLLSRPAQAPKAVPVAAAPASAAAAHAVDAASDPAIPMPATPVAAAALPKTSAATPLPAVAPRPAAPSTSPADDLRKVQQALDGGTPKQALEAANLLSACPHADQMVEAMYTARDQSTPESRQLNQATGHDPIAWTQDLQRRCQFFDAATLAHRGELFKKAYEGGAEGAALSYLLWLNSDGKQEANPELVGKLQREARQAAESGDFMALVPYAYAFDGTQLGASPMQRQAYKEALFQITGELSGDAAAMASRASMDSLEKMIGTPPLSAEQQREADALAKQVVDNWRKLHGKGG